METTENSREAEMVQWLVQLALGQRDYHAGSLSEKHQEGVVARQDISQDIQAAVRTLLNRCYRICWDRREWAEKVKIPSIEEVIDWAGMPGAEQKRLIGLAVAKVQGYQAEVKRQAEKLGLGVSIRTLQAAIDAGNQRVLICLSHIHAGLMPLLPRMQRWQSQLQRRRGTFVKLFLKADDELKSRIRLAVKRFVLPLVDKMYHPPWQSTLRTLSVLEAFANDADNRREPVRDAIVEMIMSLLATPRTGSSIFVQAHHAIDQILRPEDIVVQHMEYVGEAGATLDRAAEAYATAERLVLDFMGTRMVTMAAEARALERGAKP